MPLLLAQCSSTEVTVRTASVDNTALLWLLTDYIMILHAWAVPAIMQGHRQQECCISHSHSRFQAAAHPGRSRHPALTVHCTLVVSHAGEDADLPGNVGCKCPKQCFLSRQVSAPSQPLADPPGAAPPCTPVANRTSLGPCASAPLAMNSQAKCLERHALLLRHRIAQLQ